MKIEKEHTMNVIEPGTQVRIIIEGPAEVREDGAVAVTGQRYIHVVYPDDPAVRVLRTKSEDEA